MFTVRCGMGFDFDSVGKERYCLRRISHLISLSLCWVCWVCCGLNHLDVIDDCLAAVREVIFDPARLASLVFEIVRINPPSVRRAFAFNPQAVKLE